MAKANCHQHLSVLKVVGAVASKLSRVGHGSRGADAHEAIDE